MSSQSYQCSVAGTSCPGPGEETSDCRAGPDCPSRLRQRKWAGWGAWSGCSSSCLGGLRTRVRTCQGDRGKCFGSGSDKELCGQQDCPLQASSSDGSLTTLIVAGWVGDFIDNVTLLSSEGRACPGPSLPIWLADHFSVYDGEKVLTCGGRSGKGNTLCWHWNLARGDKTWSRATE